LKRTQAVAYQLPSGEATNERFSGPDVRETCWKGIGMITAYNGMPAGELGDVCWTKSQHSNPNGACVEVAALPSGEIAMRNSRFPVGPVLLYTQAEITAFLAGAKDGEFDHIVAEANQLTRQ
jgi:hypothetical protein